jgi:hypothetical protein
MYAIRCYRLPGYPFTHFREYKTARVAKKAAAAAIAEGWRMVEVLKLSALSKVDAPLDWKVIETIEKE